MMNTLQDRLNHLSESGLCLVEMRVGLQFVVGHIVKESSGWSQYRGLNDLLDIPAEVLLMIHPEVKRVDDSYVDRLLAARKTGGWIGQWLVRGDKR